MRLSLKSKLILSTTSFVFLLLGVEFFLKTNLYLRFLNSQETSSYFYLTYDWQKKLYLTEQSSGEDTLFFGSSRTAYAITPSKKFKNLSLIAGSYKEQLLLANVLSKKRNKVKKIYIELNAMSATKRLFKAMSNEQNNNLFFDFERTPPLLRHVLYNSQIFLQRFILRDSLDALISGSRTSDDYRKAKRNNHIEEFKVILNSKETTLIPGLDMNLEFQERLFNECETMINWTTSDPKDDHSEGLAIFSELIKKVNQSSNETIVWIPPVPNTHQMNDAEASLTNELIKVAQLYKVKILDLRKLNNINFFDCIHPNLKSSAIITETLIKN